MLSTTTIDDSLFGCFIADTLSHYRELLVWNIECNMNYCIIKATVTNCFNSTNNNQKPQQIGCISLLLIRAIYYNNSLITLYNFRLY